MTTRLFAVLAALLVTAAACGSESSGEAGERATSSTEAVLGDAGVPSLGDPSTTTSIDADNGDGVTDSPSDQPVLDENSSDDEIFAVWQPCMIEQGINDLVGMTIADLAALDALVDDPDYIAASKVCDALISDAFGSFALDPAMEAELADRSARLAACGREILDADIPDDILFLDDDDPRMLALDSLATTPEQDQAIEACLQEALGDLIGADGELVTSDDEGADQ